MSKVIRVCFCFALLRSVIGLKKLVPPTQPIMTWSHAFSRAWGRIRAFASSADWLIVSCTFAVIGHSDCFQLVLVLRRSIENSTLREELSQNKLTSRHKWYLKGGFENYSKSELQ